MRHAAWDEESREQLQNRLAKVYTERNELRQEVATLKNVQAELKSAETIKKRQNTELKQLRHELKTFENFKTQVLHLLPLLETISAVFTNIGLWFACPGHCEEN